MDGASDAARPDLRPATDLVAAVVRGVRDDQLGDPTPCGERTVGALLDHLAGLSQAFTDAARHELGPAGSQPPVADAARLDPGFRDSIPAALGVLGTAWLEPEAWVGMTHAGGIDLPSEVAGLVALDEVVVHGWDLAVATGQDYDPPAELVEGALGFVSQAVQENPEGTPGLFGPPLDVPDDAPGLHRLLALAGRDPGWTTPGAG